PKMKTLVDVPIKTADLVKRVAGEAPKLNSYLKSQFAPELLPMGRVAAVERHFNLNEAHFQETAARARMKNMQAMFGRMQDRGMGILDAYETGNRDAIPPSMRSCFDWDKGQTDGGHGHLVKL